MAKKSIFTLLAVLAAFLLLVSGFYLGRKTVRGVTVCAERSLPTAQSSGKMSERSGNSRININTATAEELQTLPMIGKTIAERIVEYRNLHGAFSGISELMKVDGIGQARFDAIKEYVTVR